MGETKRMHGKMRSCKGTDARMLDVDSANDWLGSVLETDTEWRRR